MLSLKRLADELFASTTALEKLLNRRSYRRWFKNLWESNANRYEFFKLADEIHRKAFGSSLPLSQWEKAWQSRTVLHPDYKQARVEFVNAVLGWF